jgi:S-adenosyl-L-methionine hydrolase (adenosine-forming)
MQIITLTTDMGTQDHYVAAIKGTILKHLDKVHIVDITHEVQSFSTNQAAYYLKNCFEDFPEGTIHIIGVQSEPIIHFESDNMNAYPAVLKFKNHFFIGTDNGIFSLIVQDNQIDGFWRLDDVLSNKNMFNFPVKNILVPAACKLAQGKNIESFASEQSEFKRQISFHPTVEPNIIKGNVIHIDHYGNLITNIDKTTFFQFGKDIPFTIFFRKKEYFIDEISMSYSDVPKGEKVAIFNSNNLLEIAINQGAKDRKNGASSLFGISVNDIVRVEYSPRGSKDTLESLF